METGRIVTSFATSVAGYLLCDGATYLKADYPQLNTLLGASYSVNSTQFRVPNFSDKVAVGGTVGTDLGSHKIELVNLPIATSGSGGNYTSSSKSFMGIDNAGVGVELYSNNVITTTNYIPKGIGVNYFIKY